MTAETSRSRRPRASTPAPAEEPGRAHENSPRRVLLVDDHPVLRMGLAERINHEADLCVCGEADTAREAIGAVSRQRPDVAVVDISLPDAHGLELIKDLHTLHPRLPLLVFSMHDEALYAERALQAGARGYLMKREPPQALMAAIRQVLNGEIYLSPNMTRRLLGRLAGAGPAPTGSSLPDLSDRECEVLELLGEGFSTREIAARLHLSSKTVSSHRENIKRKLQLNSGAALLRYAIHAARAQPAAADSPQP